MPSIDLGEVHTATVGERRIIVIRDAASGGSTLLLDDGSDEALVVRNHHLDIDPVDLAEGDLEMDIQWARAFEAGIVDAFQNERFGIHEHEGSYLWRRAIEATGIGFLAISHASGEAVAPIDDPNWVAARHFRQDFVEIRGLTMEQALRLSVEISEPRAGQRDVMASSAVAASRVSARSPLGRMAVGQRTRRSDLEASGARFPMNGGREFAMLPVDDRVVVLFVEGEVAMAIAQVSNETHMHRYFRREVNLDYDIQRARAYAMGIGEAMEAAGYSGATLDDGWCWSKSLPHHGEPASNIVNDAGNLWGRKSDRVWSTIRGLDGGSLVVRRLTFAQALEIASRLPRPRRRGETILEGVEAFESFLLRYDVRTARTLD